MDLGEIVALDRFASERSRGVIFKLNDAATECPTIEVGTPAALQVCDFADLGDFRYQEALGARIAAKTDLTLNLLMPVNVRFVPVNGVMQRQGGEEEQRHFYFPFGCPKINSVAQLQRVLSGFVSLDVVVGLIPENSLIPRGNSAQGSSDAAGEFVPLVAYIDTPAGTFWNAGELLGQNVGSLELHSSSSWTPLEWGGQYYTHHLFLPRGVSPPIQQADLLKQLGLSIRREENIARSYQI